MHPLWSNKDQSGEAKVAKIHKTEYETQENCIKREIQRSAEGILRG